MTHPTSDPVGEGVKERAPEEPGERLGRVVGELRRRRRLTLQEVADAAGLTKSHVWELERGSSRNPTVKAVWGLARALGSSPAALLGLDEAMPPLHPEALRCALIIDAALRGRS